MSELSYTEELVLKGLAILVCIMATALMLLLMFA
jgi:hypothetical protein